MVIASTIFIVTHSQSPHSSKLKRFFRKYMVNYNFYYLGNSKTIWQFIVLLVITYYNINYS